MIDKLKIENKIIIPLATTGIAADLIRGRTLHSMFKLPIPLNENTIFNLKPESPEA